MTPPEAKSLLEAHTQSLNLRRHGCAVAAVMKALCVKLGGNTALWETLGYLHDADWEETKDAPHEHTKLTLLWLKQKGITDSPLVHALQSHNRKYTRLAELEGAMEWALESCDELTGFIVAVALVRPDRQLASVTVESIRKKWRVKEFARAVDRTQIEQCEAKLGIPLTEFISIALGAMQQHHGELGL